MNRAKKPCPIEVKDELLVRLYALDDIDRPALIEQLQHRLHQHLERLNKYKQIKLAQYSLPERTFRQKGKLMALEMGIGYGENWVNWCTQSLKRLI